MTGTDFSDAPRPDRRGAFRLLFLCLVWVGAGNTLLIAAVLPPLTRELGLPDWTAGAMFSLSAILWVTTSPIWSKVSDRIGRRRTIAIGLSGYALSMLLFGLVATAARAGLIVGWAAMFASLLAARAVFGAVGSATPPAAQAYVAERTDRAQRIKELAAQGAAFGLGAALGPVIAGALILSFGLLSPVFVVSACAFAAAMAVLFRLPEARPPQAATGPVPSRWTLMQTPALRPFLIYGLGLSLLTGVLIQTYPYRVMDGLGLTGPGAAQYVTAGVTLGALSTLAVQLGVIPRLDWQPARYLWVGAAGVVLGCLLLTFRTDFPSFLLAQGLVGAGFGLARAGFTGGASLAVGQEAQGGVAGLVVAVNGAGFVVSPFFGLWLYEAWRPEAPFAVCALIALAMAAFSVLAIGRSRRLDGA